MVVRLYLLTWSGEKMRALPFIISMLFVAGAAGCKTAPDSLDPVALAASASASATATSASPGTDALTSCRSTGTAKGVTWQCPNDVVALDMVSDKHDSAAEIASNLDKFAEPFVGMGIARDNTDLASGSTKLRSVKLAGEKPGAGPVVARMAVVEGADATPTRYVSCAAKRDACDPVLRALLGRTPGAKTGAP